MRRKNYIGVTGLTSRQQVAALLGCMPKAPRFLLMCGVLASSSTLHGTPRHNWPERYPVRDQLGDIFVDDHRALNIVHYWSSATGQDLARELLQVKGLMGPHCHGFQLNIKWPTAPSVRLCQQQLRDCVIILQCGSAAINEVGRDPLLLARKIARYGQSIQYCLIDESGGHGQAMDIRFISECVAKLRQNNISPSIAIAGGLGPTNLHRVCQLSKAPGSLSIDAEGAFYDSGGNFDLAEATAYVKAALQLL